MWSLKLQKKLNKKKSIGYFKTSRNSTTGFFVVLNHATKHTAHLADAQAIKQHPETGNGNCGCCKIHGITVLANLELFAALSPTLNCQHITFCLGRECFCRISLDTLMSKGLHYNLTVRQVQAILTSMQCFLAATQCPSL